MLTGRSRGCHVGDLGDVSPHLAEFVGEGPSAFAEGWIVGRDEPAVPGQLQCRPERFNVTTTTPGDGCSRMSVS